MSDQSPPPPPHLDPPFRGYIETTYDSLLVFEAARRGLIPRVTRRLIERERGMVQSGAVFVFDEQESGIKRWTDGLVWSPSRILGNFLVYRETDKRATNVSGHNANDSSNNGSPSNTPTRNMGPPGPWAQSREMQSSSSSEVIPILAQGAIRPRSSSEGGMDRHRERQLVGSLTNSYKFKEGGLVKKTMSVSIGNYSQHMISYYTVADVLSGKLRAPSTIPELASLEISADYLQKQNFRFPPVVEVGQDGVPRYRGEAEEPLTPNTSMTGFSLQSLPTPGDGYDPYSQVRNPMQLQMEPPRSSHARSITHPQHTSMPLPGPQSAGQSTLSPSGYVPHSAGSQYFDANYPGPASTPHPHTGAQPIPIQRQASGGPHRPSSSKSRYDPYGSASPRVVSLGVSPGQPHHPGPASAGMHGAMGSSYGFAGPSTPMYRRQSVPHPSSYPNQYQHQYHPHPHPAQHQQQIQQQQQQDYYQQYDVKPIIHPSGAASYSYQPPATAPGAFSEYYSQSSAPASQALSVSITQMQSPITAYAPTPASAPQALPSVPPQAYGSPWQTASTPSGPPPSSQSRLVPAPSRDYGRLSLHTHRPSPTAGTSSNPNSANTPTHGAGDPPSSSGSSISANGMVAGGAGGNGRPEYAYDMSPIQHSQGGGWGGQASTHSNRSSLNVGPGGTTLSPHAPHSAGMGAPGGLGLMASSPSQAHMPRPMTAGSEMNASMGQMEVGPYMAEDSWGNTAPA